MKILLYCLLPLLVLAGCSVKPYLKNTDLPKGINYYSNDKQFTVHPDWYWRLRPSVEYETNDTVGFKYLKKINGDYNKINIKVIGELINDDIKYYVANWEPDGYFFIKELDYFIANKFKKYLISIDYSCYAPGGSILLISSLPPNWQKILRGFEEKKSCGDKDKTITDDELISYFKRTTGKTLILRPVRYYLYQQELLDINNYTTPSIKQYSGPGGYKNEFIQISHCPLFSELSEKIILNPLSMLFVMSFNDYKHYTNNNGQLFRGEVYSAEYLFLSWGEVFYALPYQPFNKSKRDSSK